MAGDRWQSARFFHVSPVTPFHLSPLMNYILEFIPQGRYVRVTAVDPATGLEAVIVGDATQPQLVLERTAIRKLEFLLARGEK